MDDYVDMAIIDPEPAMTVATLQKKVGRPLFKTEVWGGILFAYASQWSAWVKKDLVHEVWIISN